MTQPADTSLQPMLARTAHELRRCRDIVLRIELAVHGLVDTGAIRDAALGADLQAIDLLDQRLADLSDWMTALARSTDRLRLAPEAMPRLDNLRLADLRHALSGGDDPPPGDARTELF